MYVVKAINRGLGLYLDSYCLLAKKIIYHFLQKTSLGNDCFFCVQCSLQYNVNFSSVGALSQRLPLTTWQAWENDKLKTNHNCFICQNSGIESLYLESPWEMHSNKYKHAWYWFINVVNFENFEKQKRFCMKSETNGRVQSIKNHNTMSYTARCILMLIGQHDGRSSWLMNNLIWLHTFLDTHGGKSNENQQIGN